MHLGRFVVGISLVEFTPKGYRRYTNVSTSKGIVLEVEETVLGERYSSSVRWDTPMEDRAVHMVTTRKYYDGWLVRKLEARQRVRPEENPSHKVATIEEFVKLVKPVRVYELGANGSWYREVKELRGVRGVYC